MRRDLRIKSRGSDFLIGTAIFSTLTYWLAFFMILQFLGYLGPIQLWELSLPPDGMLRLRELAMMGPCSRRSTVDPTLQVSRGFDALEHLGVFWLARVLIRRLVMRPWAVPFSSKLL